MVVFGSGPVPGFFGTADRSDAGPIPNESATRKRDQSQLIVDGVSLAGAAGVSPAQCGGMEEN
jgi:hypothetical protein